MGSFTKISTFKIFVSNLPNGQKSDDVRSLFQSYGRIVECEVFKTNYAFVHMEDEESTRQAIKDLHGRVIDGTQISVVQSKNETGPKIPVMKLSVSNIPNSMNAIDLRSLFRKFGFILEAQVKGNHGHVLLEATGDIRSAINDVNGMEVGGQNLKVEAVTNFNGFPNSNQNNNNRPPGKRKGPQDQFGGRPPKFGGGGPQFQGPPPPRGQMRGGQFFAPQQAGFPGYNNYDYEYNDGPPGLGYYGNGNNNSNNYDQNDYASDDQPYYQGALRRPPPRNFFPQGQGGPIRVPRDRSMNMGGPQPLFYDHQQDMNDYQDDFYNDNCNFNQPNRNNNNRNNNQGFGGLPMKRNRPRQQNQQQQQQRQQQQPRPLMAIDAAVPGSSNNNNNPNNNPLLNRTAKVTKFGKIVVNGVGGGGGGNSGGPGVKRPRGNRGGVKVKQRKASMEAKLSSLFDPIPGTVRLVGSSDPPSSFPPGSANNPNNNNNNSNKNKKHRGGRGRGGRGGGGNRPPQPLMMASGPPQNFNQNINSNPGRQQQQMGGNQPPQSLLALHHQQQQQQQQQNNNQQQFPNPVLPKQEMDFTMDIEF